MTFKRRRRSNTAMLVNTAMSVNTAMLAVRQKCIYGNMAGDNCFVHRNKCASILRVMS